MGPDLHVVGDLDKVVDLASLPDHGAPEAGTVNGGVGPDLHIIADLDDPGLGNLHVTPTLKLVAESARSDNRTGLQDHAIPELATLPDDHTLIKTAFLSKANPRADQTSRIDDCAIADDNTGLDHGIRANGNPFAQNDRGINNSRRMNA